LPLEGLTAILTYFTCFLLACLALGLYRISARKSTKLTSVSHGTLGIGIAAPARSTHQSRSIEPVSLRAKPEPRLQAATAYTYVDPSSVQASSKVRAPKKSYYASSEGQVQTAMLLPLGIPDDGQDESTAVSETEPDSTDLGWNDVGFLLPQQADQITSLARYTAADTDAQPRQDATEDAQPAFVAVAENVAIDTDASGNEDETQVVQLEPSRIAEENGIESNSFSLEEAFEIARFAPIAVDETTPHVSADPVQQAICDVQAAPAPAETDAAPKRGAPSVHETAEREDVALVPHVADVELNITAPADQEAVEYAEIAASPVAGESGEQLNSEQLLAATETEDPPPYTATDAETQPLPPVFSFLNFYGLSEQPFDVTPDPAYLYLSPMHREALSSLSQGIENLRGFMALVAEPGMGKTTLLNRLMEDLRETARTVLLFQTQCNSRELLRYLLSELGIESEAMDVVSMHRALNEILFQEMLNGRRFVLIIDEAQNLDAATLETIRLLSDFETTHAKLIQIVLAGQPQLIETLLRPELSQLRQRIAILTNLEPLGASETAQYIEHRLRAAGSNGRAIFTPEALALIAESSHGIPRSINNLCFNALQMGCSKECEAIDADIVKSVTEKLDLESLRPYKPQEPVAAQDATTATDSPSSQLARLLLDALTGAQQAAQQSSKEQQAKNAIVLTGKLSEKLKTRSWGKECEYRIQVSLGREASPEIPVADRYYCCNIYLSEEQAKHLQPGQLVRIKIEQD
jgi:general secretion pathway protein A